MRLSGKIILILVIVSIGFGMGIIKGLSSSKPKPKILKVTPANKQIGLFPVVKLYFTNSQFVCSGTVIKANQVLTAAHCITNIEFEDSWADWFMGESIYTKNFLVASQNNESVQRARLVGLAHSHDYAILEGDFSEYSPVPAVQDPGEARNMLFSDLPLMQCGYPHGGALLCARIAINSTNNFMIQGQGFLIPGMSGGPVVSMLTGHILGVNSAVYGDSVIIGPLYNLDEAIEYSALYGGVNE